MPSEAPLHGTQTEKPQHYMYLKEFRTQQCPLFVQHKCTQHRPFTCFHWHFLNQRRRRPVKKRDGSFNYSPDIYCAKYDESTGVCPDGDDCPFLHRTAGDTERRYHLRYYKTGTCVYETDSRGNCVKNGPHCAFAHGASDLRPPVYDKNEGQGIELLEKASDPSLLTTTSSSIEKDKMPAEDPRWNDTNYVLANYKTEQCKRPPRLCRQGYACPQYHNVRDRRRSPKLMKYRSTPCPNVKHGDEWGDPTQCENGDSCVYCHTRTEQQFHPEIYKSTKCNDMVQTGSCPRGAFCAFAHVEHEMTSQREVISTTENSLAAFVTNALPDSINTDLQPHSNSYSEKVSQEQNGKSHGIKLPDPIGKERANSNSSNYLSLSLGPLDVYNKGRSSSVSSSISSDFGSGHSYHKAPGSEREDANVKLKQQLQAIENDPLLDNTEKARRKEALILQHTRGTTGLGVGPCTLYSPVSQAPSGCLAPSLSTMSPLAPAFYPPANTVESVVGNALGDLNMDDFDITSIDRELDRERDNDSNSVSSTLSTSFSASGVFSSSGPIGIPPSTLQQRGSISSLSQSPPSPFGSLPHSTLAFQLQRDSLHDQSSSPLLGHSVLSKYHGGHSFNDGSTMSPRSGGQQSPLYPHLSQQGVNSSTNNGSSSEIQRLRDDLIATRNKLSEWEGVYTQAKCACEAWRKEAEESLKRAKHAEEERLQAVKQRDEALSQLQRIRQEKGPIFLHGLQGKQELEALSVEQLQKLKLQLQLDLNALDQLMVRKLQRGSSVPVSSS
ncbi:RING finger protein unkempt homolog [Pomacea canaliculata]|uniref:RING finger protein unkempt homolog n=1 Tax=Pomacea canaliculata TaxID=400727 RepID=UPI000D7398CD|nr:RING finger protein unkempt homolog [Pomacea canaliculata]